MLLKSRRSATAASCRRITKLKELLPDGYWEQSRREPPHVHQRRVESEYAHDAARFDRIRSVRVMPGACCPKEYGLIMADDLGALSCYNGAPAIQTPNTAKRSRVRAVELYRKCPASAAPERRALSVGFPSTKRFLARRQLRRQPTSAPGFSDRTPHTDHPSPPAERTSNASANALPIYAIVLAQPR
jgi:hypothetical protein